METPIPQDFKDMLAALPGVDAEALVRALDTPASVAVRFNSRKLPLLKGSPAEIFPGATPVEWCETGLRLPERPVFTLNPLLHAGLFYVQDPSSMIYRQVTSLLADKLSQSDNQKKPLKVLDFCAAPGGKTTAIIDALPDGSEIVANEFDGRRAGILRENLEKWGYPDIITTSDNSRSFSRLEDSFEIVTVDAPCSGEGMMRKEEVARSQWSESLTLRCADLQKEILSDIAGLVRPGGFLVYSTCTFNLHENEEVALFIRDTLGLEPISLPLKGIGKASGQLTGDIPCVRFIPHLTDGEGLFLTVFRRPGSDQLSAKGAPLAEMLKRAGIRITGVGLPSVSEKGEGKKKIEIPDSRSVLDVSANLHRHPVVELDEETAISYLRRESILLPAGTPAGYVTVAFRGVPLGLVKNLGNRANNLFPQAWRIRMTRY